MPAGVAVRTLPERHSAAVHGLPGTCGRPAAEQASAARDGQYRRKRRSYALFRSHCASGNPTTTASDSQRQQDHRPCAGDSADPHPGLACGRTGGMYRTSPICMPSRWRCHNRRAGSRHVNAMLPCNNARKCGGKTDPHVTPVAHARSRAGVRTSQAPLRARVRRHRPEWRRPASRRPSSCLMRLACPAYSALAACTTCSAVMPKYAYNASAGADAPKLSMPTTAPSRPTYLYQ